MNLVIEDAENKKFHPFMHCTEPQALFVMNNVNIINAKSNTCLTVHQNIDLYTFIEKNQEMDENWLDKLIIKYNANLKDDEKPLSIWTRD